MSPTTPIWFITGASSGLGRALAEAVLARGWRAVVTARKPETLRELAAQHEDRALALVQAEDRRIQRRVVPAREPGGVCPHALGDADAR